MGVCVGMNKTGIIFDILHFSLERHEQTFQSSVLDQEILGMELAQGTDGAPSPQQGGLEG